MSIFGQIKGGFEVTFKVFEFTWWTTPGEIEFWINAGHLGLGKAEFTFLYVSRINGEWDFDCLGYQGFKYLYELLKKA